MCGRFTVTSPAELLAEFDLDELPPEVIPRYNVAPTQPVPVIANRGGRALELFRWGLIPSWAESRSIGNRMINARAESLSKKPAFRDALRQRRCLVLADGFYEWKRAGKQRVPFYVRRNPQRPFGFAGLWERWKSPEGLWVLSCAIITGAANALLAPIHDRMPVVIPREDYDRWLHPEPLEFEALEDLLGPPPESGWVLYAVSALANSPANDSPECVQPGAHPQTSWVD
jgi:putative SOS response-associated peptidase YedK